MNQRAGWDIFLFLLTEFLYVWSASRFLRTHLQGKSREGRVFGGLLFGSHIVMVFFLENRGIPYILYALCGHGVLLGLTMAIFRGERERKLLIGVILAVMSQLIWNFTDSFLCFMGLILVRVLSGSGETAFVGVWGRRAITLFTCVVGVIAVCLLSKPLEPVFEDKRKSWYLSLIAPLSGMMLVTDLANWAASNGILVQDRGRYGLFENQLFSHGAMCVFTGLSMAAAGFLVLGLDRMDRQERSGEQYRTQMLYYEMMEEQYSQMERLRHDLKNHIIALDSLIQNRQWEKAVSYLQEMAQLGGVETGDEITGSLAIDALLYHKKRQAKEQGIRWQCDARLPADCPVKDIDLCIIVGNALDNALESCLRLKAREQTFIYVYLGTVRKCLFLEARNSAEQEEGWERGEKWKSGSQRHGLGLGNMKAAAARYNGVVRTELENGVFAVSVLLPLYHGTYRV